MLRLQPSEIRLTQWEILELKKRLDGRRVMNALGIPRQRIESLGNSEMLDHSQNAFAPAGKWFYPDEMSSRKNIDAQFDSEYDESTLDGIGSTTYLPLTSVEMQRPSHGEIMQQQATPGSRQFRPRTLSDPGHEETPAIILAKRRGRTPAIKSTQGCTPKYTRSASMSSYRVSSTEIEDFMVTEPNFLRSTSFAAGPRTRSKVLESAGPMSIQTIPAGFAHREMLDPMSSSLTHPESLSNTSTRIMRLPIREPSASVDQREQLALPLEFEDCTLSKKNSGMFPDVRLNRDLDEKSNEGLRLQELAQHSGHMRRVLALPPMKHLARHETNLGQPSRNESTIAPGARPRYSSWERRATHRPRMPRPDAEQENEDAMEEFENERLDWLGRGQGGQLQRTPPGQGRLERFLWDN